MTIEKMLDEIRRIIGKCDDSEAAVYEALMEEAAGWEMRLEELDIERERGS